MYTKEIKKLKKFNINEIREKIRKDPKICENCGKKENVDKNIIHLKYDNKWLCDDCVIKFFNGEI